MEASRKGTAGRYDVTHLVVPRSLQRPGDEPRAFCGWPFTLGRTVVAADLEVGAGEVCEKCLPGLARRFARREPR